MIRKQFTLAERNVDGGHESRSLQVKISVCRIVTESLCDALVLIQLKIAMSTSNNCSSGFETSLVTVA